MACWTEGIRKCHSSLALFLSEGQELRSPVTIQTTGWAPQRYHPIERVTRPRHQEHVGLKTEILRRVLEGHLPLYRYLQEFKHAENMQRC